MEAADLQTTHLNMAFDDLFWWKAAVHAAEAPGPAIIHSCAPTRA